MTTITTYMATHPNVADAVAAIPGKIANSLSIKVFGGVGGSLGPDAAKLSGTATGYISFSMKGGAGAGGDLTGTAQLGSAGGSGNFNVPVVKDGQLANPIKDASGTLSGGLSGESGKTEVEASTTGDETSVGGTYGEGIVGGAEVSAETGFGEVLQAIAGDAIQEGEQLFSDLQDSLTMGVGGSAASQAPASSVDSDKPSFVPMSDTGNQ